MIEKLTDDVKDELNDIGIRMITIKDIIEKIGDLITPMEIYELLQSELKKCEDMVLELTKQKFISNKGTKGN